MTRTSKPKTDTKEAIRRQQRAWLEEVLEATGKTASRLADDIGIHDTTLTRFLNNPDYRGIISPMTIARIAEHTGFPPPGMVQSIAQPSAAMGFREDAVRYELTEETKPSRALLLTLMEGRPNASAWLIKTDALLLAGVRPGDLAVIDMAVPPRDGDVVIAQIEQGTGARTVFRIFKAPNLIGATFDPTAIRPEPVDGERVRIAGVMTELVRRRA
jgi:hypothetical protein